MDGILARPFLIELDAATAAHAARLGPPTVRSLDAIHLASALTVGADLHAFATYDARLAEAARLVGLPVVQPS